jgi:hypothetical protein
MLSIEYKVWIDLDLGFGVSSILTLPEGGGSIFTLTCRYCEIEIVSGERVDYAIVEGHGRVNGVELGQLTV